MNDMHNGPQVLRQMEAGGINSVFEEFEDIEYALRRREENIIALKQSHHEKAHALAKKLGACEKGERCRSGACPVCYRLFRRNMILETVSVFPRLDNLCLVTWQCWPDSIPNHKLHEFTDRDLLRIKNRFFQLFKRLGVTHSIIGSFEMVYLPETDYWRPHFHAVTSRENREVLENFRRYLQKKKHPRNSAPLHVLDINKTPVYAIGYVFKSEWGQKSMRNGGLRVATQRLLDEKLVNALLALDRLGMRKKLFLHKCKSYQEKDYLIFVA